MLAVGYKQASPELRQGSFQSFNIAKPAPAGRDLLVKVNAVSVNPVDTKVRKSASPEADEFKVLGWDAVGIVEATGSEVSLFKPGDRVFYAGDISRQGSNAEYQLVDERIVGHAPKKLSDAEAAALPLTTITAWELLFSRLEVAQDKNAPPKTLLVVAGAGGVGSILIQLARQLTSVKIIATASRPETQRWVKDMGAHHVVDHSKPIDEEIENANLGPVDYVASLSHSDKHFEACVNVLRPQGRFALIDDPGVLDISLMKKKSLSLHWEFMYTRPLFNTDDIQTQHDILNQAAELADNGIIRTTLQQRLGQLSPETLYEAHRILESGKAIGKLVLAGLHD
ncbi:zinc-binding alcohol dehydrogenase family protein [Alteromonas sp. H39]|uniref:zinc-binding alcohol dehydrogenase family protein n=1 Tax=Alteromonas sp. H39 TaxID=3389876 RepID=UPI0039E0048D